MSHLCHLKQCVNVAHLSYGPHAINNKRITCRYEGECSDHHGYDDCILQLSLFGYYYYFYYYIPSVHQLSRFPSSRCLD